MDQTINIEEMAKRYGISVSEFKKMLAEMIKAGYMKEIKNQDGSISIQVTAPDPLLAEELKNITAPLKLI